MKTIFRVTLFFMLAGGILTACKNHKNYTASAAETQYVKYGMSTNSGIPEGLAVGDTAPNFQINDNLSLYQQLEKGPVMLFFYRGYWCPVCNRYLNNIEDSLTDVRSRGVAIYGVSPELKEFTKETKEISGTSIDLISDSSYTIQDKYQVRFATTERYQMRIQVGLMKSIAETNGGSNDLPVPATFLIGKDRTIFYKQFDPNYRNRASIKEIIEALDQQMGDR